MAYEKKLKEIGPGRNEYQSSKKFVKEKQKSIKLKATIAQLNMTLWSLENNRLLN